MSEGGNKTQVVDGATQVWPGHASSIMTSCPRLTSPDPHIAITPQTRDWTQVWVGQTAWAPQPWCQHLVKQTKQSQSRAAAHRRCSCPSPRKSKLSPFFIQRALTRHLLKPHVAASGAQCSLLTSGIRSLRQQKPTRNSRA